VTVAHKPTDGLQTRPLVREGTPWRIQPYRSDATETFWPVGIRPMSQTFRTTP